MSADISLMVENLLHNKNIICKCHCECKEPIKHCMSEEDYAGNASICACECDNYGDIGEYLKDCICMKSLDDDVVVKCDEVADTWETATIGSANKKKLSSSLWYLSSNHMPGVANSHCYCFFIVTT